MKILYFRGKTALISTQPTEENSYLRMWRRGYRWDRDVMMNMHVDNALPPLKTAIAD